MALRFRQLQAFHAIVLTGTVTGAASELGISQPGISKLLALLERETKIKLFERKRGRLTPTYEASILFQEADTVVRGMDRITQVVADLQNRHSGQLQIASQHSVSFGFMPKLISRFAREHPDISVSFQSQYSSKVQEWVLAGLFEIGICELPLVYDELEAYAFHVETKLALPYHSPLATHEVLTPALLRDEPFIVMGSDHMTQRRLREAFQSEGIMLNMRVHSFLFKNLLSFVKEGMGVALVDPFATDFDFEGGFVTRQFQPPVMIDMAIITSKSRPLSTIGAEFLSLLKSELGHYISTGKLNQ